MYVARELNVTLIKVDRVGKVEGFLFTGAFQQTQQLEERVTFRGRLVFRRSHRNRRLWMKRATRVARKPRWRPKRRRGTWPSRPL